MEIGPEGQELHLRVAVELAQHGHGFLADGFILIEEHGIGIKIRHQGHIHVLSLYRGQGANKILPGPDRTDVDSELFQNIPAVKHH